MEIGYILQYGVQYIEGLALLFSLIYLKKYVKTPSKLIPIYLFLVFCGEFAGEAMASNQWIYNLLGILELLIFTYIFYFTVKGGGSKRIVLFAFVIGLISIVIDLVFFTKTFYVFLSNSFGFVSLATTIMGFVFLLEMAKTEKVINQNRILLYWVVLGLLIFHLCNLPITVVMNDLLQIGNVENILIVQSIAAIAMYFCYIIGFIWSQEEYNY